MLQWIVAGFGAFVILNLFQSLKLTDRPTYNVVLSPSLILLMMVGGFQTAINYGVMGFTPSYLIRALRAVAGDHRAAVRPARGGARVRRPAGRRARCPTG